MRGSRRWALALVVVVGGLFATPLQAQLGPAPGFPEGAPAVGYDPEAALSYAIQEEGGGHSAVIWGAALGAVVGGVAAWYAAESVSLCSSSSESCTESPPRSVTVGLGAIAGGLAGGLLGHFVFSS